MAKILVVDDDEGILDAFQAMLESVGYDVVVSSDGSFLQDLSGKNIPDLILLDVLLSGKDGREICRVLKSQQLTKKIPVIMVSAHPGVEKSVKEAGADDFLEKPFEMGDMLTTVEKNLTS